MFSQSCNNRSRRIGNRMVADHLRDRDNAAGIGDNSAGIADNSAEISNGTTGSADITANVIPC